jgi:hypothetical protein
MIMFRFTRIKSKANRTDYNTGSQPELKYTHQKKDLSCRNVSIRFPDLSSQKVRTVLLAFFILLAFMGHAFENLTVCFSDYVFPACTE